MLTLETVQGGGTSQSSSEVSAQRKSSDKYQNNRNIKSYSNNKSVKSHNVTKLASRAKCIIYSTDNYVPFRNKFKGKSVDEQWNL